ncbi:hypothetical protein V5P93_007010 [Actinokineospora auranticolor]|uniref:Uncharacterized protein n=1 Tax=Actinokineospora auranticolor TaxID=155976 RepID=A0A2S6GH53_9PSEU|nr:hypothetical protein [Actinokineospora auranticolor]PPK64535.1 hypothetical protein CLV40_119102 [Actinokineospora auranticolor]
MARTSNASRLLLRFAVTAGLVVVAWVIGVLTADSASADTGITTQPIPVVQDSAVVAQAELVGTTTNRLIKVTAVTVSAIHNLVPTTHSEPVYTLAGPSPAAATMQAAPEQSAAHGTNSGPASASVHNAVPVVEVVLEVVPVVEVPEPQPVPAPEPKVEQPVKHVRQAVVAKAPRTVPPTPQRPNLTVPEQVAPSVPSTVPDDGPQAGTEKAPKSPTAPSAPVCPATSASTASPTHDNSGNARAFSGAMTGRHRLIPPLALGAAGDRAVEPPGHEAGLPTSTPD